MQIGQLSLAAQLGVRERERVVLSGRSWSLGYECLEQRDATQETQEKQVA